MARLIVKSPYIKCGGGKSAGGYLQYIATRERVEIIPDDRPPTNKQTQLIEKLVKDFPDAKELMEYEDYLSHPTKATASALITLTLESNWDRVQGMEGYGYLPKPMKKLVDEIVDQMAWLPTVDTCYQTWWELQCQAEDYYSEGKKRLRPPLSQQKEFRQIKNAVIREAEHIRMNRFSFEDEEMQDDSEQVNTYDMSYACQDLQSVANDDRFPLEERDEAAEQLEQLAEDGDAYAQYIIGTAYRDGGLLIPDTVKAQKLLERAAKQEIDAAQYALGKLYLSDDADVHDSAKGIYWLKRSADNGNDYAAYRLGKEYLSGKNTIKDAETAVSYLRQAADNGSTYAQYLLGKLTLMGEGIPKDMDAAYEWFAAARDNGHAYAKFFMKRMERGEQEPPSVLLSATRLLYHMGNIFRDNAPAPAANGVQIDRKRLARLRQKRVALGHKPDDHEEQQYGGWNMTMR